MREAKLVASVLPADFANLGRNVEAIADAGIDRIQWDVMDGGIGPSTIGHAAAAGANVFCSGSALFAGPADMSERAATLRGAVSEELVLQ